MATFDDFNKLFFCYNSAKYEAEFHHSFSVIITMIWTLNLLLNVCWKKFGKYVQITPDHKSEKITEIVAWFTKLLQKQFHLSIYGLSVISNVSNLVR